MASFIGRSGYHLFFTEGANGVVVDSRVSVVVASGTADSLDTSREWDAGEYTEFDENAAATALSSMSEPEAEPTNRVYTIPRGAQNAARKGLKDFAQNGGGTPVSLAVARSLVAGGQINFNELVSIAKYFERHALTADGSPAKNDTGWLLNGGDTAKKWATAIIEREPADIVKPAPDWESVESLLADNPEASPEFIARIHTDGSGIDRLYRVDLDGMTYVWDDGTWTDLGLGTDGDIWIYDVRLDYGPEYDAGTTHVIIDPESAITIATLLADKPFQRVFIEDLDPIETKLAFDAIPDIDWEFLDSTLTAAGGAPGDGIYTPDERSANASKQVRNATGQFAKQGDRVMVGGNPSAVGKITRVNPADGTVEVSLESGGSTVVLGKQVEGVSSYAATIPGKPVEVPRVDFSGILAEPRTPVNRVQGTIPGTLPQMTTQDLHAIINNFPAWVKAQRDSFTPVGGPMSVGVQSKNSLNTGKEGAKLQAQTGKTLTTDAYSNPLLNEWLNKLSSDGYRKNKLWYDPITAAGEIGDGELTPDNSDVSPIYMAIVAPDDPRAVLKLVSLVPASSVSNQPMTYSREEGAWIRDPQTLNTLNSATPPPVVPLDEDSLNDVITQVDSTQGVDNEQNTENQFLGESDVPGSEPVDSEAPTAVSPAPETAPAVPAPAVAASAVPDLGLMVLWGPRKDFMEAAQQAETGALIADGGADRNRGGAEKLRRYWTKGPGAAKIRWGTAGDWTRCVRYLGKYLGPRAKGYCALRHHEVTKMWTGDKKHLEMFSVNTGGIIDSTAMVASSEAILEASLRRTRASFIKLRMQGITASASPVNRIYNTSTKQGLTAAANAVDAVTPIGGAFFIPLALPEGIESGDGRFVDKYAATIRNLPISLLWQIETDSGHTGSVVVGRIERLGRTPKGIGGGFGHFDVGVYGAEAERMVRNGMLRFVSADMDNFEADEEDESAAVKDGKKEKTVQKKRLIIDQARVMAVTIVAKPAFQEATIQIVPDGVIEEEDMIPDGIYVDGTDPYEEAALVAAGYVAEAVPLTPPTSWFSNPELQGPTPLTVDDDGRVFGHIAAWDLDHIGMASNTKPPRSRSNYGYFHTGVVRTEDGTDAPVGQLTLAGGHAGLYASARDAIKHYDDTASAVADIHVGEDKFGIWAAGAVRPGTRPEQIRALRAAAPSGDWRPIRGRLELVAVCQVNVPGFPIARTLVAGGQQLALVAAGAMGLAKMKSNPVQELAERLERLESSHSKELAIRASAIRERFSESLVKRNAELSARAEAVSDRMKQFGYVRPADREEVAGNSDSFHGGDSELSIRERLAQRQAEFATVETADEKKIKELLKERGEAIPEKAPQIAPNPSDDKGVYKPGYQPRDDNGQFRVVLARLKENLGVSGNQGVIDKLKETEDYEGVGDYAGAVKSALDLKDTLNRLDDGALNADSLVNVRQAAKDLSSTIANLPLPFDNQAAKIRFSDLPPALRDLVDDFIDRVENKIGQKDAAPAVAPLKAFKSGSDLYSQSEISSQMNKLLRLLT